MEVYLIEFTGSLNELSYFQNVLIPLVERSFGEKPHLRFVGNAIRLRYNSKKMLNELAKMGLQLGRKSSIVQIPKIFLQKTELAKRVIRG